MRIYRHALESIFAMLDLADLSRVLAVSRSWSAAVRSMAPVNASLEHDLRQSRAQRKALRPLPPIASIVRSPLLRHIAAIRIWDTDAAGTCLWTPLDNAALGLLAQHAPNLTSLWCEIPLTPTEPLVLPAKLQSLELELNDIYPDIVINRVLTVLATLPSLSRLRLGISAFEDENSVQLSLLAACPSLTSLALGAGAHLTHLSDAQVEQIRSSLGHLQRFDVELMFTDQLARLLEPPVTARWQDIGSVPGDARTGQLLLRLPSLTKLDVRFNRNTAHVDFLLQLPRLTALTICCGRDLHQAWLVPPDAVLASLLLCPCITDLDLSCGFNSAQWSALFAKLPLKMLAIRRGDIESLQCFASGPITRSLEGLTLQGINLLPSEISHLYALRRLRTLHLDRGFSSSLDDATLNSLFPPTPILPVLTKLFHETAVGDREWHGPSFEWMQQRLTQ